MPPRRLYVAEPATAWRTRPPAVVDCSVLIALLFEEAEASLAEQKVSGLALQAPTLLPFELANVARTKSRAGAPADRIAAAFEAFEDLRVDLHAVEPARMHALALAHGLTAYDAAYLALAAHLKAPLITFDQKLAEAAQRALG